MSAGALLSSALVLVVVGLPTAVAVAQTPVPPRVLVTAQIPDITLVRSTSDGAVIRVATGSLQTVHVGDRVGRTAAVVKQITRGRMILEETFTGVDGKPNVAEIIFKDGEKGGTRYLRRPDEKRPLAVRPVIVDPPKENPR